MKKLAIVGTHPDTRGNAPFDNPDFEIWVFNEAPQADWCKRWDAVFQLHVPDVYMSPANYSNPNHWPWLQQPHKGKVIWMQDYDELVPSSRRYPLQEIIDTLPGASRMQFTSSPVFALALALYLGYKEIHVWGVELSSNTEYGRQLPGWMYWCGVADGMGVDLQIHSGEKHFEPIVYGWSPEVQLGQKYYQERAAMMGEKASDAQKELNKARDRLDAAFVERKYQKALELILSARELATETGTLVSAANEAKQYAERLDPIPRQQIERRAAQAQKDSEGHRAKMYHIGGTIEYLLNVWKMTGDGRAVEQIRGYVKTQIEHAFNLGVCLGMYKENIHYMYELDMKQNAAGVVPTGWKVVKAEEAVR